MDGWVDVEMMSIKNNMGNIKGPTPNEPNRPIIDVLLIVFPLFAQPKDTLGGRFDASQALVGELSQFNLWDRVLKPAEVAALADCSSPVLGNIAPWTDLDVDVYGGAIKESLDPCHAAQRTNPKGHKQ